MRAAGFGPPIEILAEVRDFCGWFSIFRSFSLYIFVHQVFGNVD